MPAAKKFLDEDGLRYLASKLNEYPDNTILAAVINAIESEIDDSEVNFSVDIPNECLILQKGE